MKNFYNNFLDALSERHPRKPELVKALMDILHLERESVYRRLRKNILFTSEEIMQIAGKWSISLDNLLNVNSRKSKLFRFDMVDYTNPDDEDYKILEDIVSRLEFAGEDPESEMIESSNFLPGSLFYDKYEYLFRFFTMKWRYKYCPPEENMSMHEIIIPEQMRALEKRCVASIRNMSKLSYIFDSHLIENVVQDIAYFHSIRMIDSDELRVLKNELLELIDDMKGYALKGFIDETGSAFSLYMSHTPMRTESISVNSKYITMIIFKMFERSHIVSLDRQVFDRMNNMVVATIRSSVLMSSSNYLELIRFFDRQKSIIDKMI